MKKIRSNSHGVFVFIILLVLILGVSFVLYMHDKAIKSRNVMLGQQAVYDLYEFIDANDLDKKMTDLKKITTDAVFSQLTIDNSERTLNTYLKFKNSTTSVSIIRSTDSYVLYHLNNDNIDPERVFIFIYSVNAKGKLDYVRELEGIDFIENDN